MCPLSHCSFKHLLVYICNTQKFNRYVTYLGLIELDRLTKESKLFKSFEFQPKTSEKEMLKAFQQTIVDHRLKFPYLLRTQVGNFHFSYTKPRFIIFPLRPLHFTLLDSMFFARSHSR